MIFYRIFIKIKSKIWRNTKKMSFHSVLTTSKLILEPIQEHDTRDRYVFQVETEEEFLEWRDSLEIACRWANYTEEDKEKELITEHEFTRIK